MSATLSIRVGSSAIRLTLFSKGPAECSATSACIPVHMLTFILNPKASSNADSVILRDT